MEIKSSRVNLYSNALHLQFVTEVQNLNVRHEHVTDRLRPQVQVFDAVVAREDASFRIMRKSDRTTRKAQADFERDNVCAGLSGIVRASQHHFNPQIVDAATRLLTVFENYSKPTPVSRMSYEAETATLNSLVQELRRHESDAKVVGVTEWINALETKNAVFEQIVREARDEQTDQIDVDMHAVRRETDKTLHTLFQCINALAVMEGDEIYAPYISSLNAIIEHYNSIAAQHRARRHADIIEPEQAG